MVSSYSILQVVKVIRFYNNKKIFIQFQTIICTLFNTEMLGTMRVLINK